jgi:hypothetical protein
VAVALVALVMVAGCVDAETALPRCSGGTRLGIVAQSVPTAAYVPCVIALPTGWSAESVVVDDDGTEVVLRSDREGHPMVVRLTPGCRRAGSTPVDPLVEGVRSYLRIDSLSPRYSGRFFDVFPGGCLTTTFELTRGAHVALLDELRHAVGLYPRQQLAQELEDDLGGRLDP